jgi:hypothetical protein
LADLVRRIEGGDNAAIFEMAATFRPELGRAVERIGESRGRRFTRQEVDDLVLDVAVGLSQILGPWRADGGATPWGWARHRVASVVDEYIGQFHRPLPEGPERVDERRPEPARSTEEHSSLAVLERLAEQDPILAVLVDALAQVASPRDRRVFLETRVQAALGDPSPAATVAEIEGMRPEAVRKQHSRVLGRLRELARTDPRYAALADLPLVA